MLNHTFHLLILAQKKRIPLEKINENICVVHLDGGPSSLRSLGMTSRTTALISIPPSWIQTYLDTLS